MATSKRSTRRVRPKRGKVYSGTRRLEPKTPLAERLQERLHFLNWTNDELAKRMDVHKQRVSLWTIGNVAPGALSLAKLATVLGVTMEWLMQGTAEKVPVQ